MRPQSAVFIHGTGAAGPRAWPKQSNDSRFAECVFLSRPGFSEGELPHITDWSAETDAVIAAVGGGAHVVGFSFGGLPAMLAAQRSPTTVHSLCLIEPPAFSIARGDPSVEAHIASVAAVMALRDELDAAEYFVAFMSALGIGAVERPSSQAELLGAERLRLTAAPWEAPVSAEFIDDVRTLVLTGGWNAEYDAVARVLARAGARHHVLEKAGHRVQDHPDFSDVLVEFWARSV